MDDPLSVVQRPDLDVGVVGRVDLMDLRHPGDVFKPVAYKRAGDHPVGGLAGQVEQQLVADIVDAQHLGVDIELPRVPDDDGGGAGDVLDDDVGRREPLHVEELAGRIEGVRGDLLHGHDLDADLRSVLPRGSHRRSAVVRIVDGKGHARSPDPLVGPLGVVEQRLHVVGVARPHQPDPVVRGGEQSGVEARGDVRDPVILDLRLHQDGVSRSPPADRRHLILLRQLLEPGNRLIGLVLVVGKEEVDLRPVPDPAVLVDPPDVIAKPVGEVGADIPGGPGHVEQRAQLHRLRLRRRGQRPGQEDGARPSHRPQHLASFHLSTSLSRAPVRPVGPVRTRHPLDVSTYTARA